MCAASEVGILSLCVWFNNDPSDGPPPPPPQAAVDVTCEVYLDPRPPPPPPPPPPPRVATSRSPSPNMLGGRVAQAGLSATRNAATLRPQGVGDRKQVRLPIGRPGSTLAAS